MSPSEDIDHAFRHRRASVALACRRRLGPCAMARAGCKRLTALFRRVRARTCGRARRAFSNRFEPLPAAKAFGPVGRYGAQGREEADLLQFTGAPDATGSVLAEQARVTERKQNDKVTRTLGRYSARYVADFSSGASR